MPQLPQAGAGNALFTNLPQGRAPRRVEGAPKRRRRSGKGERSGRDERRTTTSTTDEDDIRSLRITSAHPSRRQWAPWSATEAPSGKAP
eukprot:5006674-Pyramimonas_sp.AAC.1